MTDKFIPIKLRVESWDDEANRLARAFAFKHPKRGPKPRVRNQTHPVIISEDETDIDTVENQACLVLGPRKRGAKQWNKLALYVDLLQYRLMKSYSGFIFSKGGRLPRAKWDNALVQLLDRHGYLVGSDFQQDLGSSADPELRKVIGKMLSGPIDRIEGEIRNDPK